MIVTQSDSYQDFGTDLQRSDQATVKTSVDHDAGLIEPQVQNVSPPPKNQLKETMLISVAKITELAESTFNIQKLDWYILLFLFKFKEESFLSSIFGDSIY